MRQKRLVALSPAFFLCAVYKENGLTKGYHWRLIGVVGRCYNLTPHNSEIARA